MAARKKAGRKSAASRVAEGRRQVAKALGRLEQELPPTLRDFSKRVTHMLGKLEKDLTRAGEGYRRQAARLLRDASRQLGRFEAKGEQGWRKLAGQARTQALHLVQQLEKAIAPKGVARKATDAARAPLKRAAAAARTAGRNVAHPARPGAGAGPGAGV